jgi:hypothetical protein
MFASIAEQYVNRYAGRFLTHFNAEHQFQLSLNTIKLKHLDINVQELQRIRSSYQLKKCFIGEVSVDLSFLIFGGKLEVTVSDVVVVVERQHSGTNHGTYEDAGTGVSAEDGGEEVAMAMDTLQTVITLMYYSLQRKQRQLNGDVDDMNDLGSGLPSLTSQNIVSLQRVLEKISLTLNRLHVRVEEDFASHVKNIEFDSMVGAFLVEKLQVRSAVQQDLQRDGEHFVLPSSVPASTAATTLVSNKVVVLEEYFVICRRANEFLEQLQCELANALTEKVSAVKSKDDEEKVLALKGQLTLDFLKRKFAEEKRKAVRSFDKNNMAENGIALRPTTLELLVGIAFHRQSRVFGPVKCHLRVHHLDWHVTDEQLLFAFRLIESIHEFRHYLQSKVRRALIRGDHMHEDAATMDSARRHRAKLRWNLIRVSVKVDWWRFAGRLKDGHIRWRAWFDIWRHAARYVALREVLMYHVGYESWTLGQDPLTFAQQVGLDDDVTELPKRSIGETLKLYFATSAHRNGRPVLIGAGSMSEEDLHSAERIVAHQLTRHLTRRPGVDPFSIPSNVLKALYSLQLELDAMLPTDISAFCRLRAEQKHIRLLDLVNKRLKSGGMVQAEQSQSLLTEVEGMHNVPDIARYQRTEVSVAAEPVDLNRSESYLFIAPVDVTNLQPSFGASTIQCQVSCSAWTLFSNTKLESGPHDHDDNDNETETEIDDTTTNGVAQRRKLLFSFGSTPPATSPPVVVADPTKTTVDMAPSTTFVQYRHGFAVPLQNFASRDRPVLDKGTADDTATSTDVLSLEAVDSNMFKMSLGRKFVALHDVHSRLSDAIATVKATDRSGAVSMTSALESHSFDLSVWGSSTTTSTVTVRIAAMVVRGTAEELNLARDKFLTEVDGIINERKTVSLICL